MLRGRVEPGVHIVAAGCEAVRRRQKHNDSRRCQQGGAESEALCFDDLGQRFCPNYTTSRPFLQSCRWRQDRKNGSFSWVLVFALHHLYHPGDPVGAVLQTFQSRSGRRMLRSPASIPPERIHAWSHILA